MFTGITEELGRVKSLAKSGAVLRLQILAPRMAQEAYLSQSVSVNGVCLTVVNAQGGCLDFELMPETARRSNLETLKVNEQVNLERALRLDGRLDGHLVSGHIDAVGSIRKKSVQAGEAIIAVDCPAEILRYIALKGSVTLDGVSLTISAVDNAGFSASLIPHTLEHTTLGLKREGEPLNIETDILAKYLSKLIAANQPPAASQISASFLQQHGFI